MSVQGVKPVRILVLLNRIPWPLNDGGAIGAYNFVKGYAEAGCEVTLLAMNTTKHFVEPAIIAEQFGKFGTVHTVLIDNHIKPLGALNSLLKGSSYVIDRFVSGQYRQALIDLLQKSTYDVVHVDGLPPAAYIPTIRAHSKARISMRAHNVEHGIWQRVAAQEANLLKKQYISLEANRLQKFEAAAATQCDVVMAISREDEAALKALSPTVKTIVVPAGMDVPAQPENTNFNAADLCFIGAFDWMPNLQGIEWFHREVWPALSSRFPQVNLLVAGKKMPESIKKLSDAHFVAVGEVPDAKAFMLQHGLLVVPIVSGSGIRIKILEGMALGKCIIATPIAAEGLGLTDGENILIAETAEAFIQKLELCLNDVTYATRIGAAAHKFAFDNYRNRSIFDKLITYYRSLA